MEAADRVRRTVGLSANARHARESSSLDRGPDQGRPLGGSARRPRSEKSLDYHPPRHRAGPRKGRTPFRPGPVPAVAGLSGTGDRRRRFFPGSRVHSGQCAGVLPRRGEKGPAVRPADIKPRWATVPLLYGLSRWVPGLIPGVKRAAGKGIRRHTAARDKKHSAWLSEPGRVGPGFTPRPIDCRPVGAGPRIGVKNREMVALCISPKGATVNRPGCELRTVL